MIDWDKLLAKLPQSAREIAEVIGYDRTLTLIGNLPTTTDAKHGERAMLYVPKTLHPDHPMVHALNMGGKPDAEAALKAAQKLVEHFGGEILHPANCKKVLTACRDANIAEAIARGTKPQEVADKLGISARQARNIFRNVYQRMFDEYARELAENPEKKRLHDLAEKLDGPMPSFADNFPRRGRKKEISPEDQPRRS